MNDATTRRQVLKSAAAAGLANLAGCAAPRKDTRSAHADEPPADWIDAHVHVWTDDLQKYPLAPGWRKEQMNPPRFTPDDLLAICEPVGVRRINLIQMSFYQFDNRYMLDAIARHPGRFAGTAIIDPTTDDPPGRMRRLHEAGVRAFRIYPALAKGSPNDWLRPQG
ncbi:MAG TPA: amidohydrolase family protein, partial [Phycisphaerae bacterium]|nr:amidohydrolase family protein [Phycisphaerae bacterium]